MPRLRLFLSHTRVQSSFQVVLKDTRAHKRTHTLLVLCRSVAFTTGWNGFLCLILWVVCHLVVAGDVRSLLRRATAFNSLNLHTLCYTGWGWEASVCCVSDCLIIPGEGKEKPNTFSLGLIAPAYHNDT